VASITVEAVRQLALAEGSEVTAVIKVSDAIVATLTHTLDRRSPSGRTHDSQVRLL